MLDSLVNKLSLSRLLVAAALVFAGATVAWSQRSAQSSGAAEQSQSKPAGTEEQTHRPANTAPRLPADVTTDQSVELPGRTLRFKATAGSIPINDGDGALQAEVAYVAYVIEGTPALSRPVTFVFNGGPGAASSYLQLGAL